MYPASRYLTACAVVLVATLVVAEPLDRRIVNDKNAASGLDNDVMPVTSQRLDKRIINGQDAHPGSHPYIAELKVNWAELCEKGINHRYCTYMHQMNKTIPDRFVHNCGGTLIHESWVLTAAHCVDKFPIESSFSALKIVLGEHDTDHNSCTEQESGVKNVFMHPDFNRTLFEGNDIALIELSTPARISKIVQIAKLSKDDSVFANTECLAAGWGRLYQENRTMANILQEVKTTIIPNDECAVKFENSNFKYLFQDYISAFGYEKVYADIHPLFEQVATCDQSNIKLPHIRDDHVCILDQIPDDELSSICHGDSGGPLTCGCDHDILVGVTSLLSDFNCGVDAPQAYTRVSAYIDWITSTAKIQV